MGTFSAQANLPRPSLTDLPNGPAAFNSLTDALDPLVIPKFASVTARNAAIPSPVAGQVCWITALRRLEMYDSVSGWVAATDFRATTTLAATAASITISGIPTTLKSLDVRWTARSTDPGFAAQTIWMRINADAADNRYRSINVQHSQGGTFSPTAYSGAGVPGGSAAVLGLSAAGSTSANVFANGQVHFSAWNAPHPNYLGWSYNTFLASGDSAANIWGTTGYGTYLGAGPFNSITLFPVAGSFAAQTQVTVIGWY